MHSDEQSNPSRSPAGGLITSRAACIVGVFCSCAALAAVFYGLIQLDLPIVHYVRSVTIHLPWDQLVIPWMAFTSQAGDWIGEGSHLAALSLLLLAVGWWWAKPPLTTAGFQTLVAHGLAALISNGLKHVLGRPRPKFVHSGEWQFAPSWTSGLDSFPSGHTTASFAVATVLARRFPWSAPLCLIVAAFVGLSRVLRGSHFPTDVVGGAVLGIVSGCLASAPWTAWRASLSEGLAYAAIGAAGAFAVLWTLSHHADDGFTGVLLMGLGLVTVASGFWMRRHRWIGREPVGRRREEQASLLLIAYGLACITTAPLVVASVGLACLAHGVQGRSASVPPRTHLSPVLMDSLLVAGVILALSLLVAGRGVLPFAH